MAANIGHTFHEKFQFLKGVSQEAEVFKAQPAYTQALIDLEEGQLDLLARFVIQECAVREDLEVHFNHFVEAFYAIEEDDYEIEEAEDIEITTDLLRRCGMDSELLGPHYANMHDEAKAAFNERLIEFLVTADDIDGIDSAAAAKDVAAQWFGGVRSIDTDHARHLKRLVQVITDAPEEVELVKDVMTRLRVEQEAEFRAHGFLIRQDGLGSVVPEDLDETGEAVEVKIPFGRRAWAAFKAEEADGAFVNGTPLPGVMTRDADLETHARQIALDHFDDPIVVTVKVPPGILVEGKIFQNYVGTFQDEAVANVALGEVNKLARADIKPLYTGMGDEQVTRLETLLFGEKVKTKQPTQQPPQPTDKPEEGSVNWGKIAKAAAVLVIGYFVVTRLWPKVNEWMNEKSVTDLTKK